ncbi:MAG: iron-containing alcohol dehydrogenase, partial [Sedimentisphaerales bacterium]|nr:iron-containing alcohol dehydrogenase [Sedimentisphaerales bacterium]
MMMSGNVWTMKFPVPVEFGQGCVAKMPEYLAGVERVLLVTGRTAMRKAGVTAQLCELFDKAGCEWRLFEDISSDPDHLEIEQAAIVARSFDAHAIVGCGGGSALDAAKAIAVAASHQGRILDYIINCSRQITAATLPIIAINSTSGTGSHVGRAAVISDKKRRIKRVLISDHLYPRAAFCDSLILRHMPREVTVATGFDAFAHAIEGYITQIENPMGNLCAVEAMRIIIDTLPRVMVNGNDLALRERMAWADTLAGICLAANSISTPHVLSMIIGGRYGATHGPAIASVMVSWLEHLLDSGSAKLAEIGRFLGGRS